MYHVKNLIEHMPEPVHEEEEELTWQRQSRFSIMRDMNEFGKFGGSSKRHNSFDGIKRNKIISKQYNEIQSQYGKN